MLSYGNTDTSRILEPSLRRRAVHRTTLTMRWPSTMPERSWAIRGLHQRPTPPSFHLDLRILLRLVEAYCKAPLRSSPIALMRREHATLWRVAMDVESAALTSEGRAVHDALAG